MFIIELEGFWKRSGSQITQNGHNVSKSDPKTTPSAQQMTPKPPPEIQQRPPTDHKSSKTDPKTSPRSVTTTSKH